MVFRCSLLGRPNQARFGARCFLALALVLTCLLAFSSPAMAGLKDDNFDGNIYALYGGNGSLIPPKVTLAEALKRDDKPALLVFYVDDSSDCKQYATVVSQLQSSYSPSEPGYYYQGVVPQTVLLDQSGKLVFNGLGQVPFEKVDDAFREVFNLLPRSESVELKQRPVNELNTELAP